jgi:hypothetical protein
MTNNDLLLFSIHHVLVFVRKVHYFLFTNETIIVRFLLDRKVIQTLRSAENIKVLGYIACNPQLATHNFLEYVVVFYF